MSNSVYSDFYEQGNGSYNPMKYAMQQYVCIVDDWYYDQLQLSCNASDVDACDKSYQSL